MKKRVIKHNDYPNVINWNNYQNTHTKLSCKCEGCGNVVYKSIREIDKQKSCYCYSCGIIIKRPHTYFEKYGVKYPQQLDEVKEKAVLTNLEKYGVKHPLQLKKFKDKRIKNNLKKYGVKYPQQLDEVKNKFIKTNIEKYGTPSSAQNSLVKEKIFLTNIGKYGTPYHQQKNRKKWQIEVTKSKENFEKYLIGFDIKPTLHDLFVLLGYNSIETVRKPIKKFNLYKYIDFYTSIGEKELTEYINSLGFETQKKRFKFGEIDIYIRELNIGFEFNGDYWHGNPLFFEDDYIVKGKTVKEIRERDEKKIDNAQKYGITIHTIWEYDWLNNNEKIIKTIKKIIYEKNFKRII